MKHFCNHVILAIAVVCSFSLTPAVANAQMNKVKTVWVILMENHNWTGNNAGAAFGAPDIKGKPPRSLH
jgi:hypothetical protein